MCQRKSQEGEENKIVLVVFASKWEDLFIVFRALLLQQQNLEICGMDESLHLARRSQDLKIVRSGISQNRISQNGKEHACVSVSMARRSTCACWLTYLIAYKS